jgi:hypothetical protein
VEFIDRFHAEAKLRKWSGFLWISPGTKLIACTFIKGDEKRVSFPGIRAWIGAATWSALSASWIAATIVGASRCWWTRKAA